MTRRETESYEEFVLRAKADPIGRRVKMTDLLDNFDLARLSEISARDRERLEKHQRALALLEA